MTDLPVTPSSPRGQQRRRARQRRRLLLAGLVVVLLVAGAVVGVALNHHRAKGSKTTPTLAAPAPSSTTSSSTTTTTQAPGPGFVAGKVTAVGDSVMIDYQQPLEEAIPGINVDAAVSRQWSTGEQILSGLKSEDQLGATVIVALSTNGPISATDFDNMMAILSGASRVVFVNTHVDQPWQDPNNQVLAQGVAAHPNTVLVDWNALADQHPEWFGSDGTHLAINGTGAQQLAQLIAAQTS